MENNIEKWEEEFEDEICYDWETFEFKKHETSVYVSDGNYFQDFKSISEFIGKWLNLDTDYNNRGKQNNKVKIKVCKGKIVIERIYEK
jgi:hypothetical protein